MKTVKNWTLLQHANNRIDLLCDGRDTLHLFVLEEQLIRVLFKRRGELRLDRTWSITPTGQDVPWQGRDRMSSEGFSLPSYQLEQRENSLVISTASLRLTVHQPLWLEWSHLQKGEWVSFSADRKTGAYQLGVAESTIAHYINRKADELYYGLGEKAGKLSRNGRRFEMRNLDAMGYNAESTDPLYKHIPFYITHTPSISYGLFYDNLATCWFDLGNELDNYHLPYRSYRAEEGDLDYYMLVGSSVKSVTQRYVRLTGGTAFGPKWSLGYSGSTMHYTDAPNAQEQLLQFLALSKQHGIACDSFQLSSGYTSIGPKRYVFNWNHSKVPNPQQMTADFHHAGVKLAANIKPCLLQDHPRYQEVAQKGLFVQDSEHDQPERSVFWDDEGSHLDFTNPATVNWWKENVKAQLLDYGIDSTWNDNNEFEVWDGNARCHGFGTAIPIKLIRPLQPLLMMRASFDAQQEHAPALRPYLISRSGCPGMNRYVQTWTGDNRTNWNTLRYNIRMGLGMSLSGLYNVGHDVGGFSGLRPDAELFVRWVQNGIMNPRFTIHSWNDDHTVNEPWMYPEVTPIIRDTIALRYRLMPYLYTLLWRSHQYDEPMLRPTFLDHEHDATTLQESDDYLLGEELLVASVVEEGQREREVYLPDNGDGWYDFYRGTWYAGKQTITLPAPLEQIPLLVRAGAVLPTSHRIAHTTNSETEQRQLHIFPLIGQGERTTVLFDDDGESYAYQQGNSLQLTLHQRCTANSIELTLQLVGDWQPNYDGWQIIVAANDSRPLTVNGQLMASGSFLSLANLRNAQV